MSHEQHERAASSLMVNVAVLTLSDTRTIATDTSGAKIVELLTAAGHRIAARELIRDDPSVLRDLLHGWLVEDGIDAVLINGGTGIARRDHTIDVVASLLTTPLPGFGELFRMLSHAQIGSAAMLSRALAGTAQGKFIAALPGSTPAVELALTRLILPQLKHVVYELRR